MSAAAGKGAAAMKDRTISMLNDLVEEKELSKEDSKRVAALAQLVVYLMFLAFLMVCVFLPGYSRMMYRSTFSIENQFYGSDLYSEPAGNVFFDDIATTEQFFDFLQVVMLPTIFTQAYYSGKPYPINQRDITAYQPHFANEVMGTLGRVRLRQLRVKDDACTVSSYFSGRVGGCYAPYRSATEETESWALADDIEDLEWRDYSDGGARASPNTKTWYGAGGWILDLETGADESVAAVQRLRNKGYVDRQTRAVFVDFAMYNPNVDMFTSVHLTFEFLPGGTVVRTGETDSQALLHDLRALAGNDGYTWRSQAQVVIELLSYVVIIGYLIRAADEVVDYSSFMTFLTSGWNVLDALNILCFLAVMGLRVAWMLRAASLSYAAGEGDLDDAAGAETDKYFPMRYTTQMYRYGRSFFAFAVLVNFMKAFKFISVSPRLAVFTSTLRHASGEFMYLMIVLFVFWGGYGIAFHMVFGSHLIAYRDTYDSLFSMVMIMMGDFDVDELVALDGARSNPAIAILFFFTYAVVMIFIIMSMLLKIVDVAYGAVTESLEAGVPSDEDFATDLKNAFRQIAHDCYWYCRLQYTLFMAKRARTKQHSGAGAMARPSHVRDAEEADTKRAVANARKKRKDKQKEEHRLAMLKKNVNYDDIESGMDNPEADDDNGAPGSRPGTAGAEKESTSSAVAQELDARRRRRKRDGVPEGDDPDVERRFVIKKLIRDGKVALIRETDVTERDVLDKFNLLTHRQDILLKLMSRLENASKATATAKREAAPVADETGFVPRDDERPFGVARPQLAPGERLTDAHAAARGQQLALERPAPAALDPTLDPKRVSAEDVERGRKKAAGKRLAKAGVPSVDPDDAKRPNAGDLAAARALAADSGGGGGEGEDGGGGGGLDDADAPAG